MGKLIMAVVGSSSGVIVDLQKDGGVPPDWLGSLQALAFRFFQDA